MSFWNGLSLTGLPTSLPSGILQYCSIHWIFRLALALPVLMLGMETFIPIAHFEGEGVRDLVQAPAFAEREYVPGVIETELTIHWSCDQAPDVIVFNGKRFTPNA